MEALGSELEDARTILVTAPSENREVCTALLEGETEPNVLFVTYRRSVTECLAGIDEGVGTIAVIMVGDEITEAGTGESEDTTRHTIETETIPVPSNLSGLTVAIDQVISGWDHPVVCFDSATDLFQYVDFEQGFEFLQTLVGKSHTVGARTHVHIDPGAHDGTTVAAITSLFDARVSGSDVRTRDLL